MSKSVSFIFLVTIISKLIGFARDLSFTYLFGATAISDSLLVSQTICTTAFELLSTAITFGFLPIYFKTKGTSGDIESEEFVNNLISLSILISIFICFAIFAGSPTIVKMFFSKLGTKDAGELVVITNLSAIGFSLSSLVVLFSAYLNAKGRFITPAIIGIPMSLIGVISYYLAARYHTWWIGIGAIAAHVVQVAILLKSAGSSGYRFRFRLNIKSDRLKSFTLLSIPIVVLAACNSANIVVERAIASGFQEGSISALAYAMRINGLISGVIVMPFLTVLFPAIASFVQEGRHSEVRQAIATGITNINVVLLPAVSLLVFLANPIVEFLYGRGRFDAQAVQLTGAIVSCYAISFWALGMRDVSIRVCFSLHDSKTPVILSVIGLAINVSLCLFFTYWLGAIGIALAASISWLLVAVFFATHLNNKVSLFKFPGLFSAQIKILIAAFAMGVAARPFYLTLQPALPPIISLSITLLCSSALYLAILLLLKVPTINQISQLQRKLRQFI